MPWWSSFRPIYKGIWDESSSLAWVAPVIRIASVRVLPPSFEDPFSFSPPLGALVSVYWMTTTSFYALSDDSSFYYSVFVALSIQDYATL